LMAAFLMSVPFMVHFPATRWAAVRDRGSRVGGEGLCGVCAVCVVRSGAAVASCWAHGQAGRDGGEVGRKGAQARATRRVAVVALRCDFFNCCWAIALALPSPPSWAL
jgi:hypothetical protein